jgi:anti-sigma factor RsiW
MNCRDAETQIFAARDAPLGVAAAAELEQHLSSCSRCRQLSAGLAAAAESWREADAAAAIPDARQAWLAVRRRIRNSPTKHSAAGQLPSWNRLLRFALPLAGACAIAVGLSTRLDVRNDAPSDPVVAQVDWSYFEDHSSGSAQAEYVMTDDEDVSPFVYVDEESGWLIVWASDAPDTPST